jgi:hypothetical protein
MMIMGEGWSACVMSDSHLPRHLFTIGDPDDVNDDSTWRGTEPHHARRPTAADRTKVAAVLRAVADQVAAGVTSPRGDPFAQPGGEPTPSTTPRMAAPRAVTHTTIATSEWLAIIGTDPKYPRHVFHLGDPPAPPDPDDDEDDEDEGSSAVRPFRRVTPADRAAAAAVLRALADEVEAAGA